MEGNEQDLPATAGELLAIQEADYRPDKLTPIIGIWGQIADLLDMTLKQAADFVEREIVAKKIRVFRTSPDIGLARQTSKIHESLLDMWTSAEDHRWAMAQIKEQGWEQYMLITPGDARRILHEGSRIATAEPPEIGDPMLGAGGSPDYLDPTHARYAPKLAAAVRAWLAVKDPQGKHPKQALTKWLHEHRAEFGLTDEEGKPNDQGIEECAKVANWQPGGGAPKTPNA